MVGSSRFGGASIWGQYHGALRAAAHHLSAGAGSSRYIVTRSKALADARWRVAIRAVQRHPYSKVLCLEQLIACEAHYTSHDSLDVTSKQSQENQEMDEA